ncbi:tyrosine-type recombinase/integrase [Zavarzinia compransoris]|uniref:Integrase n=1 Tax=Zavarzinia compransoris TaxID=1264899 RepID=A0A317E8G4_9PROT|nr:tyrosine-type recombinase/integrase [Zavarzinia compransoris]PWR23448.1 integrase [Zavarzinia compransoris]TDP45974.1 phage integrase family protein [Zavarzinia compransoris]
MAFKVLNQRWQVYDEAGRRKYINAAERARFLEQADRLAPSLRALLYVLTFTGCRVSEALALGRDHLDAERCTLTLPTLKRRRNVFRTVPVPEAVARMLLALPVRENRRFWNMHRITAWRWVRRAMRRAGILGPMATVKGLRHGFGIRAAARSVPPNLITRWMGHASAATTAIYLDAVGAEERQFAARMW